MTTDVSLPPTEKSTSIVHASNRDNGVTAIDTHKKIARIVGVFFIVATVASSLGFVILDPILMAPDILVAFSANSTQAILGVFLLLINCAAIVAIPVMLFPILKKQSEIGAVGYLGSRIIESAILTVGAISLLLLWTLSQESVQAAVHDPSRFETWGTRLLAVYDWSLLIGIMIVFSLTALILNYLFYQSKLIPRWLSGWGLIGALLLLAAGLLEIFGLSPSEIWSLPIASQEMVLAVWLIIKGFSLVEVI